MGELGGGRGGMRLKEVGEGLQLPRAGKDPPPQLHADKINKSPCWKRAEAKNVFEKNRWKGSLWGSKTSIPHLVIMGQVSLVNTELVQSMATSTPRSAFLDYDFFCTHHH